MSHKEYTYLGKHSCSERLYDLIKTDKCLKRKVGNFLNNSLNRFWTVLSSNVESKFKFVLLDIYLKDRIKEAENLFSTEVARELISVLKTFKRQFQKPYWRNFQRKLKSERS